MSSERKPHYSALWTTLVNEGPQPRSVTGKVNYGIKKDGVRVFDPRARSKGGSQSGTGTTEMVLYIDGKHKPKTVIKKWLEINERRLEAITDMAIHKRICDCGQEFKEPSREVLGPFESMADRGGDAPNSRGGACDMCGEEYERYLADHLPECEG